MAKSIIKWTSESNLKIGDTVKVWFDKNRQHLLLEGADSQIWATIYATYLEHVMFGTEKTPRGAVRCFAVGTLLNLPGSADNSAHEAVYSFPYPQTRHIDFYWWRDKEWPIDKAKHAILRPPHGGFPVVTVTLPAQP